MSTFSLSHTHTHTTLIQKTSILDAWYTPVSVAVIAFPRSIVAWRISRTEEPGRLQSVGITESDVTEGLTQHKVSSGVCACARAYVCF